MKRILGFGLAVTVFLTSTVSVLATSVKEVSPNSSQGKQISELKREENAQKKEKVKQIVDEKRKNNDNSVPIVLNGKEVKTDVPPVIKEGRVLVPIRAVTTSLGADVTWDDETKTATVTKAVYSSVYGNTSEVKNVEIKICLADEDDITVTLNGKEVDLDVEPATINGRIVVPIRFIAETLLNEVQWDEELGAVVINGEDEDDDVDIEDVDDEDDVKQDNHKSEHEKTKDHGKGSQNDDDEDDD